MKGNIGKGGGNSIGGGNENKASIIGGSEKKGSIGEAPIDPCMFSDPDAPHPPFIPAVSSLHLASCQPMFPPNHFALSPAHQFDDLACSQIQNPLICQQWTAVTWRRRTAALDDDGDRFASFGREVSGLVEDY
ncbi:hypothetical protein LWI28_006769 [Acer negundo]|uniref:Uncharacterized protein n=1 Tax=Acer negundo TaxID=4023 RepID=A0AAD5JJP2_ACENE|nr:hypothetical protein LWI28_006769 [Acer negundo]